MWRSGGDETPLGSNQLFPTALGAPRIPAARAAPITGEQLDPSREAGHAIMAVLLMAGRVPGLPSPIMALTGAPGYGDAPFLLKATP